ncbi:hypothetical protein HNP84_000777 [Thermocatellispora tengchongensis]|uniref:DUF2877 domain-containing protein n=1 Tax=Thermocatellispora tengchongensis TaxID=1073253 RepID=A0A840NZI8_9ACTN|nr:DUF2877 domain-containing protein [Thermocatellispora tengchongensis]MBB5131071.1 hypothetical protein [Thermocatellispora tengchongensis]
MTIGTRPRARRAPARATARTNVSGAASAALRPVLDSPRKPARVLAAFPAGLYLEVRTELEPHVIAVLTGEATRLPNAVVLAGELPRVTVGDEAVVGDGAIEVGRISLRARRWWNPAPPLGSADPARLAQAAPAMAQICRASSRRPGLEHNGAAEMLADGCVTGSLVGMITAAEHLVGLGPGLTPSGDDVLAGLMVALRHLGHASGAPRAVWLADWLAAAVTFDARTRTTPISATLLHCAARGEASLEVLAVLRGIAGRQALEPALARLLTLGHTSGADLACGLRIGLDAVLGLTAERAA